jgi:hypothetical protein
MKDGVERLAIVNAPTTSMAEIVPSTALHLLAFASPTAATRIALSQASRPNIAVVMRAKRTGVISSRAILGGLHHRYARV